MRRFRVDWSTTPGRLWLLLVSLVILSLVWGCDSGTGGWSARVGRHRGGRGQRAAQPGCGADLPEPVRRGCHRRECVPFRRARACRGPAAVRILVSPGLTADDLRRADGHLDRLALDEARRQQLTVEILRAALDWAGSGQQLREAASDDGLILGCEPDERALRIGLESGYRALARLTPDRSRRIELVDMANAIRPLTWT